jgi:plasmid maintenance system antidote protein VapI
MLLEEFLLPMGITQRELADAIESPYQRVNEIVKTKLRVTHLKKAVLSIGQCKDDAIQRKRATPCR